MIVVYISGPITGKRDNNRRVFEKAHAKIIEAFPDIKIIDPQDVAREIEADFDLINKNLYHKKKPQWGDYMRRCIPRLCIATHVYFLKGWENSKGAALERHIAETLDIPCVESIDALKKAVGKNYHGGKA
jgi:hypothetical protein